MKSNITPCLWFDHQAEAAANYYLSIFPNSKITAISRYTDEGKEFHGKDSGTVMTVTFELNGQPFTALNGGPDFKFSEAISFQIECETQEEIDTYWEKLGADSDPKFQQCGWIKDKFGLSWQVVPKILSELLNHSNTSKSQRAMHAMLRMKKLDIAGLQKAFEG